MNTQTLEFPPLAPDQHAIAPVSIKETVLSQFKAEEPRLLALAGKYRDVAFDVTTTKGMEAAKSARLDLRENGRFLIRRAVTRIKGEVNDLKRTMDEESDRLVAIIELVEESVHQQIAAEEERKAAAKAEADRVAAEAAAAESERLLAHEHALRRIKSCITMCVGKTSAELIRVIAQLEGVSTEPEWQEFQQQAVDAKAAALEAVRAEERRARIREDEQAELARLRADKAEREARELADRQALERAENERLAAEEAAARAASEAIDAASRSTVQQEQAPQAETPGPAAGDLSPPAAGASPAPTAPALAIVADTQRVGAEVDGPATLKLGTIADRLGFNLTQAFMDNTLKMAAADRQGRGVLYRENQWPTIKAALIKHIGGLA